jgi:hypothetical protein
MSTSAQRSLEVDQTLRLARDAIEHDIARYRVVSGWPTRTAVVMGRRTLPPTAE